MATERELELYLQEAASTRNLAKKQRVGATEKSLKEQAKEIIKAMKVKRRQTGQTEREIKAALIRKNAERKKKATAK